MTKYHFVIISFCILLLNLNTYKLLPDSPVEKKQAFIIDQMIKYDFTKLRDTIYTLSKSIVEVDLATQHAKLRTKDGFIKEFPISSGTDKVEKGIKTKEGLFAIHSKSPKLYSIQFDSTVMLNWMGFNFGIGFHALEGNGYYKYLGKKNVSHGCLRISREDAKEIYKLIEIGTPVLVHSGTSAIHIEFGNQNEIYKYYSYKELKEIIPLRIEKLYKGEYLISDIPKLLVDAENLSHPGLDLGNNSRIPKKQLLQPASLWLDKNLSEESWTDYINGENKAIGFKYTFNTHLDSLLALK